MHRNCCSQTKPITAYNIHHLKNSLLKHVIKLKCNSMPSMYYLLALVTLAITASIVNKTANKSYCFPYYSWDNSHM